MSRMKDRLRKRQASNAARSSNNRKVWFTLPPGVDLFEVEEENNLIDILPFEYGTNLFKSAYKEDDRADKGEIDYVIVVKVHRYIGPLNTDFVCPKQFGKPCPVCEEIDKLKDAGKKYKDYEKISPKNRVVYNVRKVGERGASIQLWEGPFKWIEAELQKRITRESAKRGEMFIADYEEGYSLSIWGSEDTHENNKFIKPGGFEFQERTKQPGEAILKETIKLDSLIELKTYKEIEDIFFGIADEEEDLPADSEDSKEFTKEDDNAFAALTVKDEDVPEIKEEAEPVRKRRGKTEAKVRDSEVKCSQDHIFGKDCENTKDCETCPEPEWKLCTKEKAASLKK